MEERQGSTRRVIIHNGLAVKFAINEDGKKGNLQEAELWERYHAHPRRSLMLCPVLWCAKDGSVSIMPAAQPVPPGFAHKDIPDWDYRSGGDDGCPWEHKAADWGIYERRLVAVDYGNER